MANRPANAIAECLKQYGEHGTPDHLASLLSAAGKKIHEAVEIVNVGKGIPYEINFWEVKVLMEGGKPKGIRLIIEGLTDRKTKNDVPYGFFREGRDLKFIRDMLEVIKKRMPIGYGYELVVELSPEFYKK